MRYFIYLQKYFIFNLLLVSSNNQNKINFNPTAHKLSEKEVVNFKPPEKISLNFVPDIDIYFRETLNKYVYYVFIVVNILTPIINMIGLYAIENIENQDEKKYVYMLTGSNSIIFLNILLSLKLNYFTYKNYFFIGNNFINMINFFLLHKITSLQNTNTFYIILIFYIIVSNVIVGISSFDKVLKLDVDKLLKEIQKDAEKESEINLMF